MLARAATMQKHPNGGRRAKSGFPLWGSLAIPAGILWGALLGVVVGAFFGSALIGGLIGTGLGVGIGLVLFAAAVVSVSDKV